MTLRSEQFDDVYFSAIDGLAETRHVFLDGNNLPAAWEGREKFVIAETGFGTGLNFLAVWKLFEETAAPDQKLHFISVEKFPLSDQEIEKALMPWKEKLPQYQIPVKEGLKNVSDSISLALHIGDVNDVLPALSEDVDCWFMDGFKPSSNPEMWTDTVFQNMARLTKPGGTFATFTAAGFVRRGLQEAGFDVYKVPGFGTKREMLTGVKR